MKQMKEKLSQILDSALGQIEASKELDKLNEIRVSFLGKKGELTSVLKSMKEVRRKIVRKSVRWSMRRDRR